MKKFRTALAFAAILCLFTSIFSMSASAVNTSEYAAEVARLANAERKKANLTAFNSKNAKLNAAAQKRAEEISVAFSHLRPDDRDYITALWEQGIYVSYHAENIAKGQPTPAAAMASWMTSTNHKANILGDYTQIGVGVYEKDGVLHWVQMFLFVGGTTPDPDPDLNPDPDTDPDPDPDPDPEPEKEYFKLWGKTTDYEKDNFWNWVLLIACFGWVWMVL